MQGDMRERDTMKLSLSEKQITSVKEALELFVESCEEMVQTLVDDEPTAAARWAARKNAAKSVLAALNA